MRINPAEHYTFPQTHTIAEASALAANDNVTPVGVAGRLTSIRGHGNIFFADMRDETGEMQIAAHPDTPEFDDFRTVGVGDWLGVEGETGKTRRGEPSVFVKDWALLATPEVGFPDMRNGLTDPETRVRQRYLDTAVNPASMRRFQMRSQILTIMRRFFEEKGFMEVETPILQAQHGGASARPFTTHHNALGQEMALRIAPELYLKRLVVGGFTKVFEIGKDFRNEGMSPRHNPEFTMMEAYIAYQDYAYHMDLTENLVERLAQSLHGTNQIEYQGRELDLSTPWRRATMDKLVSLALGEEVSIETPMKTLRHMAEKNGIEVNPNDGPGVLLAELFGGVAEFDLWQPTFVVDYPAEVSPLARDHRNRPGYTERFEGFVAGRELCNGYTELNDARIQHQRFQEQADRAGDEEAMPFDHDYVRALRYGLPPTAGLGIGVDRLAMLLTNAGNIRDVILFPTLRNEHVPPQF